MPQVSALVAEGGPDHIRAMTDAPPLAADTADIRRDGLVERCLPPAARPYARLARLDRPIGTWLLLFPGWWAIALAAPAGLPPDWLLLVLFAFGAVVMRGAGCTLNDIVDRDFDGRVARTRTRPIPAGEVSVRQAAAFLALQLLLGFLVLVTLPPAAIWLGVGVLGLIAIYPFMKRVTWWPQLFLGLTFNWGALLGWAAATGGVPVSAYLLYVGGIAWTLGYDTIYAHQDKEDDMRIGVKSSALALGEATRPWLFVFYAVALALFLAAGLTAGAGWIFAGGAAAAAFLLFRQAATVDIDDPADCLRHFRANRWVGWAIFLAAAADRWAG
jgi:4-hydroxybenzoate polyprenyltransferase